MPFPSTENGYNMYDILSCMQKAIRRGKYELAGFAANELKYKFRKVMWNRLFVISSEDCYGILTKELLHLYNEDQYKQDSRNISNAVALLCRALKSRDACYFSCNFILDNRNPRHIAVNEKKIFDFCADIMLRDDEAFPSLKEEQFDFFMVANNDGNMNSCISEKDKGRAKIGMRLEKALEHRDMDEIGFNIDLIRKDDRQFLWAILKDYAIKYVETAVSEIYALCDVDSIVNGTKKEKDEIFISKAVMILCYAKDERFDTILSNPIIDFFDFIDWNNYTIKSVESCCYHGELPDFVFDCHTLKGKRMGKTDWDMTVTEQAALTVLKKAYFDDASWIYTYEQDYRNGVLDDNGMRPIREFAKTHVANPVDYIPYC